MRGFKMLNCLGAVLVGFALVNSTAEGQEEVQCEACRFDLARQGSLSSDDNGVLVNVVPFIAQAGDGFLLAPTFDGTLALWHNGRLENIGRSGLGPNEFAPDFPVALMVTGGQRAAVIHRNRVSWISIEDRRVVKQQTLAWRPAAAVVVGDYLVVASPTSRVLVLNSDGDSVVSFGLPDPPPNDDVLRLAASGDSAIWVGSVFRYRLDLIRLDGSHIAGFERKPSWLVGPASPRGAPAPRLYGFREMTGGLLMVVGLVVDPQWSREMDRSIPLHEARSRPVYDTVVEVLDTRDMRLLTSARYDQFLRFVAGSDLLFTTRETAEGDLFFDLFNPVLRR